MDGIAIVLMAAIACLTVIAIFFAGRIRQLELNQAQHLLWIKQLTNNTDNLAHSVQTIARMQRGMQL